MTIATYLPPRLRSRLFTTGTVQTAAYTASEFEVVLVDPSGGAFTVTLPPAGNGALVVVKNTTTDTTAVTLDADGSDTIEGNLTIQMATGNLGLTLMSDGAGAWYVISSGEKSWSVPAGLAGQWDFADADQSGHILTAGL